MKNNNIKKATELGIPSLSGFITLIVLVIVIQIASGFGVYFLIDNWSDRASFGDMFGAIGTLFSGLAFAGVIYTILLQRRDLEIQRRELEVTRGDLERTAKAQEKSQLALKEQAQALKITAQLNSLALIPSLYCNIRDRKKNIEIKIDNIGIAPAYDIDIIVLGVYSEEYIDLPFFISKYVNNESKKDLKIKKDKEGFYCVFDRLVYPMFPQKKSVLCKLGFPLRPSTLYLLLQYRDIQGENYHQLYWYFDNNFNSLTIADYRLGALDPVVPANFPRIIYGGDDYLNFKTVNKKPLPSYISKDIRELFKFSASTGTLKNEAREVEDRGTWTDI